MDLSAEHPSPTSKALNPLSRVQGLSKILLVAASLVVYTALYLVLNPLLTGYGVGAISFLPVILGSLTYGVRGGLITGLVAIGLNIGLFYLGGGEDLGEMLLHGGGTGFFILIVGGGLAGYLKDLRDRLNHELIKRREVEAALQASLLRNRQAVDNSPNPIFSVDRQEAVLIWNQACQKLLGDREDLGGGAFEQLFKDADMRRQVREMVTEVFTKKASFKDWTLIYYCRDGSQRSMLSRLYPVYGDDGSVTGCMFANTDVSELHRTTERLQESEARLRQISQATFEGIAISENGVMIDANDQLVKMLGFESGEQFEQSKGMNLLEFVAPEWRELVERQIASGSEDTYKIMALRRDGSRFPVEVRGRTMPYQGRTVRMTAVRDISDRVHVEESLRRRQAILEAVSFAATQVLRSATLDESIPEVLKRLGQAAKASRAYLFEFHYAEEGVRLMSQRYEWAAPGIKPEIDNPEMQNFPMAERGFARMETLLLQGELIHGHVRDFPLSEQALLHAQNILSLVIVPIFVQQEPWGFIGFDECLEERDWSSIEMDALKAAASTLGASIQRVKSDENLRRRAEELAVLHRISVDITAANDLSTLLNTIVERAVDLLGGVSGGLYLCEPEERQVRCVVSYNTPADYTGTVLNYGEGAAGAVASTGKPLIVDDYSRWPGRAEVYEGDQPFSALISVPMLWQEQVTGVIHVLHEAKSRRFTQTDQELLSLFANQAAVALENARLYEAWRQRVEELDALRATMTELSAELEMPRLLQSLLARAVGLLEATGGDLGLYNSETRTIEIVASHNMGQGYLGTHMALGEGAMGQAVQSRESVVVEDYAEWEGRSPQYIDGPWHAVAAVPLISGGHDLGAIGIVHADPDHKFDSADLNLLDMFAQQAAVAIENARLFTAVQRHARQMALLNDITRAAISAPDLQNLLQRLADRLGELFDASGAYLTLWDESSGQPVPFAAYGPSRENYPGFQVLPGETTMTASVLKAGKVLVAEDVYDSPYISPRIAALFPERAMLGLPLTTAGRKLGAALISFQQPRSFSQDEIALAEQAAGQIALAISRMQLLEVERYRSEELSQANRLIMDLGRIAARIESASDAEGILETLGAELRRLGINCLIALKLPEGDEMLIHYLSLGSKEIRLAEKLVGIQLQDYRITPERFPFFHEILEHGRPLFEDSSDRVVQQALPMLPGQVVQRFSELIELTEDTRWLFLPLTIEQTVIGTFWLWGEVLESSLLPAAGIFGSQVAAALENARLYREVMELAVTDELTNLFNRRGLLEIGRRELDRASRNGRPFSVMMLDIDHFKTVNDTYGHPAGDQVLRILADRCTSNVRAIDVVGRYGGEEFLVLLPDTDVHAAYHIAERLLQTIVDMPMQTEFGDVSITLSAGLACTDGDSASLTDLIKRADQALYQAKHAGRNQVTALGNGQT